MLLGQNELGIHLLKVQALARKLRGGLDERLVLGGQAVVGFLELRGVGIHLDFIAHPVRNLLHHHRGHRARKQHGRAAQAQDDEREPGGAGEELVLA